MAAVDNVAAKAQTPQFAADFFNIMS